MKSHLSLIGIAIMGLSTSLPAQAANFTFTKIADDTGSPFSSFSGEGPSINKKGAVTFRAYSEQDGEFEEVQQGIFSSDGRTITTIAETNDSINFFNPPAINDRGKVAYLPFTDGGTKGFGIFTGDGRTTTTIADTSGPFEYFLGTPSINNEGTVAFGAVLDAGGGGVFASDGSTTTTIVANPNIDPIKGIFPPSLGSDSISDQGIVTFRDGEFNLTNILIGDGRTTAVIADDTGPFSSFGLSSINNRGTVVFQADLDVGGQGIFTGDGRVTTTIADSNGPFAYFSAAAINNNGTVAFRAELDAGGEGIFVGPDPVTDKVIASGDTLFGSTVDSVSFLQEGLNDKGQIAFYATLEDNNAVMAVAVPEPSSGVGLLAAIATLGAIHYGRRRRKQLHKSS